MDKDFKKTEEEFKKELSSEEYGVLRGGGTEPAFSGEYWDEKKKGMYLCRACGNELFSSDAKFDSGTGWPSFYQPASGDRIEMEHDSSFGMDRTEVKCARCGSHLGHVFEDGPRPTGKRFCINSLALRLEENKK